MWTIRLTKLNCHAYAGCLARRVGSHANRIFGLAPADVIGILRLWSRQRKYLQLRVISFQIDHQRSNIQVIYRNQVFNPRMPTK